MSLDTLRKLAPALLLAATATAQANLPEVQMRFLQPTGTVAGDQPIEVWVELTAPADGPALNIDSQQGSPFGLSIEDLPQQGWYYDAALNQSVMADFVSHDSVYLNTYYVCSGDFTNVCSAGAYQFDFHVNSAPGKPSINFQPSLILAPGASMQYLFGVFNPVGGAAAPGSYSFTGSGATLNFRGMDADGHLLEYSHTLGETCTGFVPGPCGFTREVTAVPEPQTWLLMLAGLAGVSGLARRRLAA